MSALPPGALLDLTDLDAEPEPPEWLVDGTIERGSVVMIAGDSGTGKSIVAADLMIAVVQGRSWLGRDVQQGGAVYVDCEMQPRLALRRLRALGLRSCDTGARYWRRPPLQLSDPDHADALRDEIEAQRPALLVLDSAIAVSGCDPNDNRAVADFCAKVRGLAEGHNLVAVIVHHEAKSYVSADRSTASAAKAALGAMSWRAQSDLHISLQLPQHPREPTETTAEGNIIERYRVDLRLPKVRDFGDDDTTEGFVIESVRTPDRALLDMAVRHEGRAAIERTDVAGDMRVSIVQAVGQGATTTAEIAAIVGADPDGGTFKRGLCEAVEMRKITKPGRGRYGPVKALEEA